MTIAQPRVDPETKLDYLGARYYRASRSDEPGSVRTKGILDMLNQLMSQAKQEGFSHLRITGTRYFGANKGKFVDLVIDLREFR